MMLQDKQTGTMVEVLDVTSLVNPVEPATPGRVQSGQEEQPPTQFSKEQLIFPSGEDLPRCWVDSNYRLS